MTRLRRTLSVLVAGCTAAGLLFAFQRPFREYPGVEYEVFPLPPDYKAKTEWVFARMMYPSTGGGWGNMDMSDWRDGASNWTIDYPRSDRHFAQILRRLTRVDARSVEQPVNLEDGDDVFHWPWLYSVEPGHWRLTDPQVAKLREYLLRGGFLMCDDFHGTREWAVFASNLQRVFPDRPIVEIDSKDAIFHTLYDLDDRYQVPGAQYLYSGRIAEKDGFVPHWRGVYDDKGRVMVAICFNMDLGDSWEWADEPQYPEKFSALGMRIAIDYVIYAMTH